MIRTLIAAGLLAAAGMVSAQEEIARWDFSQGKIDSVDGKFKMRFRGNTKIAGEEGKQYLDVGLANKDKPEGIITVKKYPELTPKGAFRLEVKARLREQSTKKPEMALWDNNYVMGQCGQSRGSSGHADGGVRLVQKRRSRTGSALEYRRQDADGESSRRRARDKRTFRLAGDRVCAVQGPGREGRLVHRRLQLPESGQGNGPDPL